MSRWAAGASEQVRRFECPCPGDLLQMDTKRLAASVAGQGDRRRYSTAREAQRVGYEFCHSIIDDHTGWPTPRSTATKRPPRSPASSNVPWPSSPATASSRTALADRQRLDLHPQRLRCASCCSSARSSTAGSRRARRSATARSSATNKRSPANGPTGSATATQTAARQRCPSGSTALGAAGQAGEPRVPLRADRGHPLHGLGERRGRDRVARLAPLAPCLDQARRRRARRGAWRPPGGSWAARRPGTRR